MSREPLLNDIQSYLQSFAVYSYLFQHETAVRLGLHPTDLQAIHALHTGGKMTAGELARCIGLTSGAATAAIDRLARLGYARRETDEMDRRKIYVVLEGGNIARLKEFYAPINKGVEEVLSTYSELDLKMIARFLSAVTKISAEIK